MDFRDKPEGQFRWHFLTGFLLLTLSEIFRNGFQDFISEEAPVRIFVLLLGSLLLGFFLFIGEFFMFYLLNGVSKGLKRIKGLLLGE